MSPRQWCDCNVSALDVIFIIDESGSTRMGITYRGIGMSRYVAQRLLVKDIMSVFTLGDDAVKVGVIGFAGDMETRTLISLSGDRAAVESAIDMTRSFGGTGPVYGLEEAMRVIGSDGRDGVTKIVVTILDGKPVLGNYLSVTAGSRIRAVATSYVLMYAQDARPRTLSGFIDVLEDLGSLPSNEHVAAHPDMDKMADFVLPPNGTCTFCVENVVPNPRPPPSPPPPSPPPSPPPPSPPPSPPPPSPPPSPPPPSPPPSPPPPSPPPLPPPPEEENHSPFWFFLIFLWPWWDHSVVIQIRQGQREEDISPSPKRWKAVYGLGPLGNLPLHMWPQDVGKEHRPVLLKGGVLRGSHYMWSRRRRAAERTAMWEKGDEKRDKGLTPDKDGSAEGLVEEGEAKDSPGGEAKGSAGGEDRSSVAENDENASHNKAHALKRVQGDVLPANGLGQICVLVRFKPTLRERWQLLTSKFFDQNQAIEDEEVTTDSSDVAQTEAGGKVANDEILLSTLAQEASSSKEIPVESLSASCGHVTSNRRRSHLDAMEEFEAHSARDRPPSSRRSMMRRSKMKSTTTSAVQIWEAEGGRATFTGRSTVTGRDIITPMVLPPPMPPPRRNSVSALTARLVEGSQGLTARLMEGSQSRRVQTDELRNSVVV